MRVTKFLPLVAVALGAGALARCGTDTGGGGDTKGLQRCEADLSAYLGSGTGASAKVAAKEDLLTGEAAQGRAGDVLLKNDRIQVVIEQADRNIGPQPYGGNIIDADVLRPGQPAQDSFGELGSLFQFGRTVAVDKVEVLRDGSAGGAAVVAATGMDSELDFVHLQGMLSQYLPGITVPDADKNLHLRITKYYVLPPGSNAVKVVDAFCNDSTDPNGGVVFAAGDLVDSGGQVQSFTGRSGFSVSGDLNPSAIANGLGSSEGEPFMAWTAPTVSYGLIPASDRNGVVVVAGVTAAIEGGASLLDWTNPNIQAPEGAMVVEPGKSTTLVRDFVVAAEPGAIYAAWYAARGVNTDVVAGKVSRVDGSPAGNVRVAALRNGKVASLVTTAADGTFSGPFPDGELQFIADDDVTRSAPVTVTVGDAGAAKVDLALPGTATIVVHIRDAAANPSPGKATVVCQGKCATARADATAGFFRDVKNDVLPTVGGNEVFTYRYLDPTGDATILVPEGAYTVYLSHGPEFSLEKRDVTLERGDKATIEAQLVHVVDTAGWMSGDFHVHAINSPDSPIANVDRLNSFMAEGVDVIVSTDHDYITDFTPFMEQIPNSTKFLKAITGVELTTFDYGHYNAFPLVADKEARNGGAVDWAGGRGPGMTPGDIYQALDGFPGEQVVQINHAQGGTFSAIELDTRTFWTRGKPETYRMHAVESDAATGDTRLFDTKFTAMEVQNGFGGNFYPLINDWMSFLSRGLYRTATAVSDTHERHGQSGYPRTYVRVGTDDPAKLDTDAFAHAVNQHQAFGTNGPFVLVTAKAGTQQAQPGETLASNGGEVTVDVEVRTPEWLEVNEVQLFVNATGTETNADLAAPKKLPEATKTLPLKSELVEAGTATARVAKASYTFTPEKDAWIVAVVTGDKDMFPVIGRGNAKPLAFTNAVLVDTDGKGWTPPVDLAAERARIGHVPAKGQPLVQGEVTEAKLRAVLGRECSDEVP